MTRSLSFFPENIVDGCPSSNMGSGILSAGGITVK